MSELWGKLKEGELMSQKDLETKSLYKIIVMPLEKREAEMIRYYLTAFLKDKTIEYETV